MSIDTKRFLGKVVLVTGAGHGIGRAIAERFGAEGANVIVNDIDPARAQEVATAIGAGKAMGIAADISNSVKVKAMFAAAVERFGTVHILVNNAGNIYATCHFLDSDEAWWDKVLNVNLKGAYLCSLEAAKAMARKGSGVIINMSSGGATHAHRGNVAYDASKGGIEGMSRAMALDLAPYGIRVNIVVPGLIRTYDISDADAKVRGEVVPMNRLGTPEDMVGPTVFLASDDAQYMTGARIVVDGGVLVQQRPMPVETFGSDKFPKIK